MVVGLYRSPCGGGIKVGVVRSPLVQQEAGRKLSAAADRITIRGSTVIMNWLLLYAGFSPFDIAPTPCL